jgi:hypothetical protein
MWMWWFLWGATLVLALATSVLLLLVLWADLKGSWYWKKKGY